MEYYGDWFDAWDQLPDDLRHDLSVRMDGDTGVFTRVSGGPGWPIEHLRGRRLTEDEITTLYLVFP